MTDDFENASKALKEAIQKFPQSPTIQDTKYMHGLALAQQGIKTAEKSGSQAAKAPLDDADKQFREIINARQDLVLMNNSFMQLGDVLSLKASYAPRGFGRAEKTLRAGARVLSRGSPKGSRGSGAGSAYCVLAKPDRGRPAKSRPSGHSPEPACRGEGDGKARSRQRRR
jgi:hypothetical protein